MRFVGSIALFKKIRLIRHSLYRVSSPLPFRLMADGLLLARAVELSAFGTLAMWRSNVASAMMTRYGQLISVQWAVI